MYYSLPQLFALRFSYCWNIVANNKQTVLKDGERYVRMNVRRKECEKEFEKGFEQEFEQVYEEISRVVEKG